jgi:hypothetical protein
MKSISSYLSVALLLSTINIFSQAFTDHTTVDISTFTYNKGVNYPAPVNKGEYSVGEFSIVFSSIVSEGQHDHMFKDIKDALYSYVCSSCKPLESISGETIENVSCEGVLFRYRIFCFPKSWTYAITITFPLQDKDTLKTIRKEIESFLKELINTKIPNLGYKIRYDKKKIKLQSNKS